MREQLGHVEVKLEPLWLLVGGVAIQLLNLVVVEARREHVQAVTVWITVALAGLEVLGEFDPTANFGIDPCFFFELPTHGLIQGPVSRFYLTANPIETIRLPRRPVLTNQQDGAFRKGEPEYVLDSRFKRLVWVFHNDIVQRTVTIAPGPWDHLS